MAAVAKTQAISPGAPGVFVRETNSGKNPRLMAKDKEIEQNLLSEKSCQIFKKVNPEFDLKCCSKKDVESEKALVSGREKDYTAAVDREKTATMTPKTIAKVWCVFKAIFLIGAAVAIGLQFHVVLTMVAGALLVSAIAHAQNYKGEPWVGSSFVGRLTGYSEVQYAEGYVGHCLEEHKKAKEQFNQKVSVLETQHTFFAKAQNVTALKTKIANVLRKTPRQETQYRKELTAAKVELERLANFHKTNRIKVQPYQED